MGNAATKRAETTTERWLFDVYFDESIPPRVFREELRFFQPTITYFQLEVVFIRAARGEVSPTMAEKLAHVMEYAHESGVYQSVAGSKLVSGAKMRKLLVKHLLPVAPNSDVGEVFLDSAYYQQMGLHGRKLPWRGVQEDKEKEVKDFRRPPSRHPAVRLFDQRVKQEYFFQKIAALPMFQEDGQGVCAVRNLEVAAADLYGDDDVFDVTDVAAQPGAEAAAPTLTSADHLRRMFGDGTEKVHIRRRRMAEREATSMHRSKCKYLVIYVFVPGHVFSMVAAFDDHTPRVLNLNTTKTHFLDWFGVVGLVHRIDRLLLKKKGHTDESIRRLRSGEPEVPDYFSLVRPGENLQEGEAVGYCQSWDTYMLWYFFKNGADVGKIREHLDSLFQLPPGVRSDRIRDVSNRMFDDALAWHKRRREGLLEVDYEMSTAEPPQKRLRLA
jgi:hypothetical protein